jgi:hypothetical protein
MGWRVRHLDGRDEPVVGWLIEDGGYGRCLFRDGGLVVPVIDHDEGCLIYHPSKPPLVPTPDPPAVPHVG